VAWSFETLAANGAEGFRNVTGTIHPRENSFVAGGRQDIWWQLLEHAHP